MRFLIYEDNNKLNKKVQIYALLTALEEDPNLKLWDNFDVQLDDPTQRRLLAVSMIADGAATYDPETKAFKLDVEKFMAKCQRNFGTN